MKISTTILKDFSLVEVSKFIYDKMAGSAGGDSINCRSSAEYVPQECNQFSMFDALKFARDCKKQYSSVAQTVIVIERRNESSRLRILQYMEDSSNAAIKATEKDCFVGRIVLAESIDPCLKSLMSTGEKFPAEIKLKIEG